MKNRIKIIAVILAVVVLPVIISSIDTLYFSEKRNFNNGLNDAELDFNKGNKKYHFCGIPNSEGKMLISKLKELGYIVTIVDAADRDVFAYRNGYNQFASNYASQIDKINVSEILQNPPNKNDASEPATPAR